MSTKANNTTNITKSNISNKRKIAIPLLYSGKIFSYFELREWKLINLLYKHGVTQGEIANEIGVDPSYISKKYPRRGRNNDR